MKKFIIHKAGYFTRKRIAPRLGIIFGKGRYRYFDEIMDNEWLPRKRVEKLQLEKLNNLLTYVIRNVPYYSKLNKLNKGMGDSDIISLLNSFPEATKEMFQNHFMEMLSEIYSRKDLFIGYTGGSTGNMLKLFYDKSFLEKKEGVFMRLLSWGGWTLGEPVAILWGGLQESIGTETMLNKIKRNLTGYHLLKAYTYDDDMIAGWIRYLADTDIRFIYGYASVLFNIAKYQKRSGMILPKVKAIFSTAETLFPHYREAIEDAFQCKVYNQYGSREVIGIGCECEKGNMHILSDMVFTEFIREPNKNDTCRIVVTSFMNLVMPFVRYDIGDYGMPKDGQCSCGRGFPLMEMNIGRMRDHILKPDGALVHGSYFTSLLYGIEGIKSYQYRQKDINTIDLLIERGDSFSTESEKHLNKVEERMRKELGWEITVRIVEVNRIPVPESGKHCYVICEI